MRLSLTLCLALGLAVCHAKSLGARQARHSKRMPAGMAKMAFDHFDKDGNSVLDKAEFGAMTKMPAGEVDVVFGLLDKNGDGVSLEEMKKLSELAKGGPPRGPPGPKGPPTPEQVMAQLDENKDGELDWDEARVAFPEKTDDEFDGIFEDSDKNGDDAVDME